MKNKILFILITFVILFFGIINIVLAEEFDFEENSGLIDTGQGAGYDTDSLVYDSESALNNTIGNIIKAALSFLGVIFLILMIYGGFLWMTAKGNEEEVTKAKNLINAAIIGLIIVVSAYAISYFVIKNLSGAALPK